EAIAEFEASERLSRNDPLPSIALACAYAGAGQQTKAESIFRDSSRGRGYVSPFWKALVYSSLGDKSSALDLLEKGRDEHDIDMVFLRVTPLFDPLRNEPRFQKLLKRIGLAR